MLEPARRISASSLIDAAIVLALLVVLSRALVVTPIVGVANNGDFYRMAPQCGVYYLNEGRPETHDPNAPDYVSRLYRTGPVKNPQGYYSSGLVMMALARLANDLVRHDDLFDIRFLGAVHATALVAVFVVWLRALSRFAFAARWSAAFLALFMLKDLGYFSYFNSFYSESASLIYLYAVAATALVLRRDDPTSLPAWHDVFFLTSSALLVTAKPQNGVLAPILVVLWWFLRFPAARRGGRRNLWLLATTGLFFIAASGFYLTISPFKQVNRYNHIFHGILEEDPATKPSFFGLGAEYAVLTGTHWWSPLDGEKNRLRASTVDKLRYRDIARYYFTHPSQFQALYARGAEAAFVVRPGLGNFTRERGGPPGELSASGDPWTRLKRRVFPRSPLSLTIAALGLGLFLVGAALKADRDVTAVAAAFAAMATVQFFAVLIGGGHVELVRHLFLFNVLVDVVMLLSVILLSSALIGHGDAGPSSNNGRGLSA